MPVLTEIKTNIYPDGMFLTFPGRGDSATQRWKGTRWMTPVPIELSTGTGTISSSGTAVTGVGTFFTSQLAVGDRIRAAGQVREVTAITSDTALTVDTAFSPALIAAAFQYVRDVVVTWTWKDCKVLANGDIVYEVADLGDWIDYKVVCPATSVYQDGTLNCKLQDLGGGANLILPATAGQDATHRVNLTDGTARPVPASTKNSSLKRRIGNGFWSWGTEDETYSYPDEGFGEILPKSDQEGWYNLYDVPIEIAHFIPERLLLGSHLLPFSTENVRVQWILPHWTHQVTIHHAGGTNVLKVIWGPYPAGAKT